MTELKQITVDDEKTNLYISSDGDIYRKKDNGYMRKLKMGHRRY